MKTEIPFQGFYESIHGMYVEEAVTQEFTDDYGDVFDDFWDKSEIDWKTARRRYVDVYIDRVLEMVGEPYPELKLCQAEIESIVVNSVLDSPREYNFSTDAIVVDLPEYYVAKLWTVGKQYFLDQLKEMWRESSTRRDGFIPFYMYEEFEIDFNERNLNGSTAYFTTTEIMRLIMCDAQGEDWETFLMESAVCSSYVRTWDLVKYTGVHAND